MTLMTLVNINYYNFKSYNNNYYHTLIIGLQELMYVLINRHKANHVQGAH